MSTAHTATQLYKFRKPNGKAIGTAGWSADHEKASCTVHTGLYKGSKVVALLVVKGSYEGLSAELNKEGEFIVRACNTHDDLVKALQSVLERYTGLVNCGDCGNWDCEKEKQVIAARAALAKAGV